MICHLNPNFIKKIENDLVVFDILRRIIFTTAINIEKLNNFLKNKNIKVILENKTYVVKYIYKNKFLLNCIEQKYHLNYRNLKEQFQKKYTKHLFKNIYRNGFENFFYKNMLSSDIKIGVGFLDLYFSEFNIKQENKRNKKTKENEKKEERSPRNAYTSNPSKRNGGGVYNPVKLEKMKENRKRKLKQRKEEEERILELNYNETTEDEKSAIRKFLKKKTKGKRLSCGKCFSSNKLQTLTDNYAVYTQSISLNVEVKENIGSLKENSPDITEIKLCYCWECRYKNLKLENMYDFLCYRTKLSTELSIDFEIMDLIFEIWEYNKDREYHQILSKEYIVPNIENIVEIKNIENNNDEKNTLALKEFRKELTESDWSKKKEEKIL